MALHPHDNFIRAWLDGVPVQYLAETGVWVDLVGPGSAQKSPHWYADSTYRLKPQVLRYRVWADKQMRVHIASSLMNADAVEKLSAFKAWVCDWTEVTL